MARKLPPAKDWKARELKDWNVHTFHAYLMDEHKRLFRVPYYPFGAWGIEQKMLKTCIAEYGQQVVKEFIDTCFKEYKPNPNYPGINFGFMFKYKNNVLQRIILEQAKQKAREELTQDATSVDDDWI